MTAPLPLKYAKDRSLVDGTRIRWAGLGDIILGLLFLAAEGFAQTLIGLLLLALGGAVWVVSRFGTRHFSLLTPLAKMVIVVGALGFLFIALFPLLWRLINKIVDALTKK